MTAGPERDPETGLPLGPEVDPTPARTPEPGTALEGRFVRLVPLDPAAHGADLYRGSHGPGHERLWRYLFPAPFPDEAGFRTYLEKGAAGRDPFFLAILDRATGEAVGFATYMRIEPAHRVIEVGNILFTPKLQHRPGATEAMYLMARHAFEELGYRRYEWKCDALNAPSRRAAERLGFGYEGTFRQHMIVKGRSRDTAWYAMLDRDWPARRRAFERWLDAANFEPSGEQRLRLSALNAPGLAHPAHERPLRRAGAEDLEALVALQRAAYAANRELLGVEPLPLQADYGALLGSHEVWLAEGPGGPKAALILDPTPGYLLVWSIAVAPASQRQGLGDRLLGAAEARARQLDLRALRLYTGEKLTRQVRWYHRHGYAIERVEELPDRRLVHMTKIIR